MAEASILLFAAISKFNTYKRLGFAQIVLRYRRIDLQASVELAIGRNHVMIGTVHRKLQNAIRRGVDPEFDVEAAKGERHDRRRHTV